MKHCSNITIMDGEVVTFAPDFFKRSGGFGDSYDSLGHFEISASRNMVIVHNAAIRGKEDLEDVITALRHAYKAHQAMRANNRHSSPLLFSKTPTDLPKE